MKKHSTNAALDASTATPNFAAIKQRQHATWSSGDYAVVGTTLQIIGETLAEPGGMVAGDGVLDVAAVHGNVTLAASRRFANVTSADYGPALVDRGRERAQAEGLIVGFLEADVENLPFTDASFDVGVSTLG